MYLKKQLKINNSVNLNYIYMNIFIVKKILINDKFKFI